LYTCWEREREREEGREKERGGRKGDKKATDLEPLHTVGGTGPLGRVRLAALQRQSLQGLRAVVRHGPLQLGAVQREEVPGLAAQEVGRGRALTHHLAQHDAKAEDVC
jgi:hypothetical protein